MIAYGTKGCNCFYDDDWAHTWQPNVSCRFHGLLSPYQPPRAETGTYRVVSLPEPEEAARVGSEAWFAEERRRRDNTTVTCGCGLAFTGPHNACSAWLLGHDHKIEKKEKRGVLAAVRRWGDGAWYWLTHGGRTKY